MTRHPATTAAAIASADEPSGGRALLTLASGDTGVYNPGLKPAKLRQFEEYLLVLRELFEHGQADCQGNTMKLNWVERPVPICLAADGPEALRLGGKVADGVVDVFSRPLVHDRQRFLERWQRVIASAADSGVDAA